MTLELDRNSPPTDHTSQSSQCDSNNITPSKVSIFTQSGFNSVSSSDFIYTPGTLIGTGSFAQVFKATHKKTERIYALKIIDKSRVPSVEQMNHIKNEINILSSIYNQHIVKLLSHFEDSNSIYLLMPYLSNGQLYTEIQKLKHLDETTTAQLALDIIDAVQYLHSLEPKVLHRDIKTENILLDDNKRALLTDFGTGTYLNKGENRKTYCGSPEYLAPEIVKGNEYDERVDIWAIGILIFEMLSGTTPFKADNSTEIFNNITSLKIQWPYDMSPLPKNLISKILKLDPNERLTLKKIKNHPFFFYHKIEEKVQTNSYNKAKCMRSTNRKESLSLFHKKSLDESLHPLFNQIRNELDSSRHEISKLKEEINKLTSTNNELLSLISTLTDENNNVQTRHSRLQFERDSIAQQLDETENQIHEKDLSLLKLQQDFNSKEEKYLEDKNALTLNLNQIKSSYNNLKDDYTKLLSLKRNFYIEDFQFEYIGDGFKKDKCKIKEQLILAENMFKEIKNSFFDIISSNCKEIKAISSFYKNNNDYIRQCYLNSFTVFNTLLYQMDNDVNKTIEETMTAVCTKQQEQMKEKVKWLIEQNELLQKYKETHGKDQVVIDRLNEEKKNLMMKVDVSKQQIKTYEQLIMHLQDKLSEMSSEVLELKFTIQNIKEEKYNWGDSTIVNKESYLIK